MRSLEMTAMLSVLIVMATSVTPRFANAEPPQSKERKERLDELSQANISEYVSRLSDPNSDTRLKAAERLRSIFISDASRAPNWHDEAYWKMRIAKIKTGMSLDDSLEILFPEIPNKERKKHVEGDDWSGGTGNSFYRLDDYWQVMLLLENYEKPRLTDAPKLLRNVRVVWIKPQENFTGLWITWYVNGMKANEAQYRDGKIDGTFTAFREDGSKAQIQHFEQGMSNGPDTGWFKSGKKAYEGQYINDKMDGKWRHWRENGKLETEVSYKNGQLAGSYTTWFENGQMQYEDHYRDGKREGLGSAWDEHGKLVWSRIYHNDEVVVAK